MSTYSFTQEEIKLLQEAVSSYEGQWREHKNDKILKAKYEAIISLFGKMHTEPKPAAIKRGIGETMIFSGGNEHASPAVSIEERKTPPWSFSTSKESSKVLRIHEAGYPASSGIQMSIETLENILAWAKGEKQ